MKRNAWGQIFWQISSYQCQMVKYCLPTSPKWQKVKHWIPTSPILPQKICLPLTSDVSAPPLDLELFSPIATCNQFLLILLLLLLFWYNYYHCCCITFLPHWDLRSVLVAKAVKSFCDRWLLAESVKYFIFKPFFNWSKNPWT